MSLFVKKAIDCKRLLFRTLAYYVAIACGSLLRHTGKAYELPPRLFTAELPVEFKNISSATLPGTTGETTSKPQIP